MRRPEPRLVAERPADDAGVVLIPQHHSPDPVEDGQVVAPIVAEALLAAMGLDVGLVDHVEPEFVAQVVEDRIVGVVRRPDRVEVVRLHRHQVVPDVGRGDGLAPLGVMIVAVDPVQEHRGAVDQQLPIPDLDRSEPDRLLHHLGHRAVGIDQRHQQPVPGGRLVRPRTDALHLTLEAGRWTAVDERRDHVGQARRRVADADLAGRLEDGGRRPVPLLDPRLHGPPHLQLVRVVDRGLDREGAGLRRGLRIRPGQPGGDRHRAQCGPPLRPEVHLAVQPRHPPVVLVLDPAGVGPADDLEPDDVRAGAKPRTDVELAGKPGVLAHADEPAVDPDRYDRFGTADVQDRASPRPPAREPKGSPVEAGRVLVGDPGRLALEGHDDVGVVGPIAHVLEGPVAGHLDPLPPAVVVIGVAPIRWGSTRDDPRGGSASDRRATGTTGNRPGPRTGPRPRRGTGCAAVELRGG